MQTKLAEHKKNLVVRIMTELCPRCGQAPVFQKQKHILHMPEMHKCCEKCGYRFDREPGYFLGAMYISYGISVFLGLITFLLLFFIFPELPTIWIPILILLVIALFAVKSWKLSRIIYMHIFPW